MTKSKSAFDVQSAEPILFYVGPGVVSGIAATDLSANALARLAWIRGALKGDPTRVGDDAIAKVRDELVATGKYDMKPVTPATEVTDE